MEYSNLIPRGILAALLATALLLPTAALVLWGTAQLLAAMDDTAGAVVVERVLLAVAIIWLIDLIALVCVQGANALADPRDRGDD
jgi:hypothetical protein